MTAPAEEPMCYVAKHPECGGCIGVRMDTPDAKAETAKFVAKFVKSGYAISRITAEECRTGAGKTCKCNRKRKV